MNEIVNKLISLLKPTIKDLDEVKKDLSCKTKTLNDVIDMLDKINNDVTKVPKYANQELILSNLNNINTTEREYNACCYLLNSEKKDIKSLPQYIEASNYIERLINYFKKMEEELALSVSELEVVCNEKSLNKKYYEIFNSECPVVDNTEEFRELIDKQELTNSEKINLLIYTINSNLNSYLGRKS